MDEKTNIATDSNSLTNQSLNDTTWKFESFRFFDSNQDMANRDMEVRDDKDNIYRVTIVNSKVSSLKINNALIPATQMGQYQKLLQEIDKSYYAARDSKRAAIESAVDYSEKNREALQAESKGWDRRKFKSKDRDLAGDDSDQKVKTLKKTEKDQEFKRDKALRKQAKIDKDRQKEFKDEDSKKYLKDNKLNYKNEKKDKKSGKDKELSRAESSGDSKQHRLMWINEQDAKQTWKDKFGGIDKASPDAPRNYGQKKRMPPIDISADQQRVRGVISELIEQKVISRPADLEWFGLSEEELVVNGNKQPAELQQKLKDRYEIRAGHGLYYGPVKMSGKGVFLDKENL